MRPDSNVPSEPQSGPQNPDREPEDVTAQTPEKPGTDTPKEPVIRDWASI